MNTRLFALSTLSAVLLCAGEPAAKVPPVTLDHAQPAKVIQVAENDVTPINARLRFTSMIVLPKEEVILDFVCGDKEFWVVNGTQNFAFVKPAKAASQTNLNLITASGNVYSFVLTEGGAGDPDLKVFVQPKDVSLLSARPRFVAATALDDYRAQVDLARTQAAQAKQEAAEEVARKTAALTAEVTKLKAEMPHDWKFEYEYKDQPGFNVRAMYHDGKFTYIKANPQEVPALYEMKDDKENLVEYRFDDGLYIVNKVLDRGWLRIGKKRLDFERKG